MKPSEFPITCMVCSMVLKGDQAYLSHMQSAHGTSSPDKAMGVQKAKEQNLPKDIPVVVTGKDVPPSAEFMEMANLMDKQQVDKSNTTVPVKMGQIVEYEEKNPIILQEKKPIILKYKYEGNCPECDTPIRTIIAKTLGKTIAIAYCLDHEQVKEREVHSLDEEDIFKETLINNAKKEVSEIVHNAEKEIEEQIKKRKEMKKHE